ncbi:hypothetical protein ASPACDRAFT_113135 [Aspergillus aculeatus ATCC 16872]|uniref:SnoaL-like domain-containing protein n=1 Tax=Aspergillus aculeatus (strain ATCC 16872 / CBS 172.66 / WB 5094) TaxID=690307 RepID=A0A1L9X2U9_ASPA1|nr:uncharacterized protein ASPACDRAFT_113135 [Aspergillus aculeatus ATCC 16872]OJK02797.1 hypothetical protein ASPACDRAFT_113135 [Aspergillus aculeatus ATCC 16872]
MTYQIASHPTLSPPRAAAMISFLESFYRTSDTESAHDQYVQNFTEDATLIMGPKTAKGRDEIRTLRHGLWTHVASRKHTPERVYFGGEGELMLYGTVKYVLRNDPGNEVEVPWAGRVVFGGEDTEEGDLRMRFYQVYLDPSAQSGRK